MQVRCRGGEPTWTYSMCGDEIFRGLAMMFWLKSDQLLFFTAQLPTGAVNVAADCKKSVVCRPV